MLSWLRIKFLHNKLRLYDENQNGQGPKHLKFFLLVFAKDEAQAQAQAQAQEAQVQTMRGKAKH